MTKKQIIFVVAALIAAVVVIWSFQRAERGTNGGPASEGGTGARSIFSNLASADRAQRERAKHELLARGPSGFAGLRRMTYELAEIVRMTDALVGEKPERGTVLSGAEHVEQARAAIEFFLGYEAYEFLVLGLQNRSLDARAAAVEALNTSTDKIDPQERPRVVASIVKSIKDWPEILQDTGEHATADMHIKGLGLRLLEQLTELELHDQTRIDQDDVDVALAKVERWLEKGGRS